jgi:hypothetical protein
MQKKKQPTIERTLLIGATIGLLIGMISKRVAGGILTGIGLSFLIAYLLKDKTPNEQE